MERRRKVIVAGETSRLARAADLKELDRIRVQLKDAEDRQVAVTLAYVFMPPRNVLQAPNVSHDRPMLSAFSELLAPVELRPHFGGKRIGVQSVILFASRKLLYNITGGKRGKLSPWR